MLLNIANAPTIINMDKNALISPHFKLYELANNKGDTKYPQYEINEKTPVFLAMLEQLREWYNKPIKCNSCYRQEKYNAQCGGMPDSMHLNGLAFDWGVQHTKAQQQNVIREWLLINQQYKTQGVIGVYPWGYHLSPYATATQIAKGITTFYTYTCK